MVQKARLPKGKFNLVPTLTILSALLIIVNGFIVSINAAPIVISPADPYIVRINTWEEFASKAQEAKTVTIVYNPPSTDLVVEASTKINLSETEQRNAILTFSGNFLPPGYSGSREIEAFKTWVSQQLNIDIEKVYANRLISVEEINSRGFWWRLSSGLPGFVENGLAYAWLSLAFLLLLIGVYLHLKPIRRKRYSIWIIIISLLSLPIGGGFIIGTILGLIAGLAAIHETQKFKETFIGKILNTFRFSAGTITKSIEEENIQTAVLTIVFISLLSSFGSVLYAYNVNMIYSSRAIYALKSAYSIFINGAIFTDLDVYFGTLEYISIGIIKWLLLSLILYLITSKLLRKNLDLTAIATIAAYAYTPELIQLIAPVLFTNEPYLSKGMSIGFFPIPVTWPITLYLISRIWIVIILVISLSKALDISKGKAFGITLFAGTLYFFSTYMTFYNQVTIPGLMIKFSSSDAALLIITSIAFLIAMLFGAFKKEA